MWKVQHLSSWMTSVLHRAAVATGFDELRQLGQLTSIVSSCTGSAYLAEGYTGWPEHDLRDPAKE